MGPRNPHVPRSIIRVALVAAGAAALRRKSMRWGATGDEARGMQPGDDLLPRADVAATRAITIRAGGGDVWPWLVQLGQGRGGFYTYEWLENLVGADIHNADRVLPAWQQLEVGDEVRLAPDVPLRVAVVEPGRALVLRGGIPMGRAAPPYDFTWAFVLVAAADGAVRLVVRERYAYTRRWAGLIVQPVQVVSFVMTQRMLRGIKQRAEKSAVERPPQTGDTA